MTGASRSGGRGVEQPVPGDPAGEPKVPEDQRDGDAAAEQGLPRVLMRVGQLPGEPINQRRLAAAGSPRITSRWSPATASRSGRRPPHVSG